MEKIWFIPLLIILSISFANAQTFNPYSCINYEVEKSDINIMFSNWWCDYNSIEIMEFNEPDDASSYMFLVRIYGMGSRLIDEKNTTVEGYDVYYMETLTKQDTSEFYYVWNCNNASYAIFSDSKPALNSVTKAMITPFCINEQFLLPHINYKTLLETELKQKCIYQIGRTDLQSTDVLIREGNPEMISDLMSFYVEENGLVNEGRQIIGDVEYQIFEHPVFGEKFYVVIGDACAILVQGTDSDLENNAVLISITPNFEKWESNDNSLLFLGIVLIIIFIVILFLAKQPPGYTIPKKDIEKNKLNEWRLDKFWKRVIYFLGATCLFSIFGILFIAFWLGEKTNPVFDKIKRINPGLQIATNTQKLLVILGWWRIATILLISTIFVIAKFI